LAFQGILVFLASSLEVARCVAAAAMRNYGKYPCLPERAIPYLCPSLCHWVGAVAVAD